jgi:hypothetical protein
MTAALDTIGVRKDIYSIANDWKIEILFVRAMPRMVIDMLYLLPLAIVTLKPDEEQLKIENLTDCITMYFGYLC